jgi:hypothetical protein
MTILSVIALALFVLLGYSMGATIATPNRRISPGPIDLISLIILWVAAFITRAYLGKWLAIFSWLIISLIAGLLITLFQKEKVSTPDPFTPPQKQPCWWRLIWLRWMHFSARFGNYQSRALLACLYFSVVLPFGIAVRLFGNPLDTRTPPATSAWHKWMMSSKTMDEARRQF